MCVFRHRLSIEEIGIRDESFTKFQISHNGNWGLTMRSGFFAHPTLCPADNPLPTATLHPLCIMCNAATASCSENTPFRARRCREMSRPVTVYSASCHCLNFRTSGLDRVNRCVYLSDCAISLPNFNSQTPISFAQSLNFLTPPAVRNPKHMITSHTKSSGRETKTHLLFPLYPLSTRRTNPSHPSLAATSTIPSTSSALCTDTCPSALTAR